MPQLDQSTFLSQVGATIIFFGILFFLVVTVVLPTVYKAQRVRDLSLAEADWQVFVVSTVMLLTSFTKCEQFDVFSRTAESILAFKENPAYYVGDDYTFCDKCLAVFDCYDNEIVDNEVEEFGLFANVAIVESMLIQLSTLEYGSGYAFDTIDNSNSNNSSTITFNQIIE